MEMSINRNAQSLGIAELSDYSMMVNKVSLIVEIILGILYQRIKTSLHFPKLTTKMIKLLIKRIPRYSRR